MSSSRKSFHRLLSDNVRLAASARRALYATLAALISSGIWWLVVRYAPSAAASASADLQRLSQAALALKVHGATAFATLFALGAMSVHHVRPGWTVKRNRVAGSVLIAIFSSLIATGYVLYYLADDETHAIVSLLHWALGIALAPMLVVHLVAGRRNRRSARARP